jgi:ankyrin repeat protein
MLIESGASIDQPNTYRATPLLVAVREGLEEIVKELLEHGADVNVPMDRTPFDFAAENNHFPIMKLLLQSGSKVC